MRLKSSLIVIAIVCALVLPALVALFPWWSTLQSLPSPDGRFTAVLSRVDHIDRNYSVKINGARVYTSPDFAPRRDIAFCEKLAWDRTGNVVVLEIAGHRVFGYDATSQRRLTDEELLKVDLPPDPPLWEYHFESEWPGVGRAKQPEVR